jgi:hypothetical protein
MALCRYNKNFEENNNNINQHIICFEARMEDKIL